MSERRSPQDASAWIEWSGGNQPVDDEVLLEVVLKNGMQYEEYSDEIRWSSRNDRDVARYRVVGAAA
ncbi:hypothetical protein N5K21_20410 [Rhizobium pusense]|uniref:Uncharacterized protein n=1 Tax=Agrobacterium pusense TaxID=648995 RepID=A0A6H0ZKW8_9HYPH|nr:hypothetical protein [Agrobacterium pusense]MDH2091099.1 hypothetical protein [Agrobacterium pusense]QIX20794.1 hypothetical protein FOB41_06455 [Agrobacterium pusense]QIX21438.1 hypothetical protein FOB41_09975 [Agrobacterium pusense]WCK22761.1 hypothetical protein CFBP5496_0008320 [Agrobacterium pusense]